MRQAFTNTSVEVLRRCCVLRETLIDGLPGWVWSRQFTAEPWIYPLNQPLYNLIWSQEYLWLCTSCTMIQKFCMCNIDGWHWEIYRTKWEFPQKWFDREKIFMCKTKLHFGQETFANLAYFIIGLHLNLFLFLINQENLMVNPNHKKTFVSNS